MEDSGPAFFGQCAQLCSSVAQWNTPHCFLGLVQGLGTVNFVQLSISKQQASDVLLYLGSKMHPSLWQLDFLHPTCDVDTDKWLQNIKENHGTGLQM